MSDMPPGFWIDEGKEGVFRNLPADTYHAARGVSHSMLKNITPPSNLPVYMKEKREPTAAMLMGTFVHSLILEPDVPLPKLAIKPEGMKFSTIEGKAWRDAHKGLIVIKEEEHAAVFAMARAVSRHPLCVEIFKDGTSELSVFKEFHLGGTCLRKGRMDFVPNGGNCLVDIKTCLDASEDEFPRTSFDSGYFTQAAYYLDLWNDSHPKEDAKECFAFIAVEKTPPHNINVFVVAIRALEVNRGLNVQRLQTYMECMSTGVWPGYSETIKKLDMPNFGYAKLVKV